MGTGRKEVLVMCTYLSIGLIVSRVKENVVILVNAEWGLLDGVQLGVVGAVGVAAAGEGCIQSTSYTPDVLMSSQGKCSRRKGISMEMI